MSEVKVDKELILSIARNARLKLSEKEIELFKKDFKEVLGAFSKLRECNAEEEKPAFHVREIKNVFRKDIVRQCIGQEKALKNVKFKKNGFIIGPKVIE